MAVRSPMQWAPGPTGGFSSATPGRLIQRVDPGGYGPDYVNVRDQRRDPDSLWSFMQTLIQSYRECPELGWGEFAELKQPERSTMVHSCTWRGSMIVAVHNFAADPVTVDVTVPAAGAGQHELEDVHSGQCVDLDRNNAARVELEAYGHRWWRVRTSTAR
jgi:hypothetical protein